MRSLLSFLLLAGSFLVLIHSGCHRELTPEEKHADSTLALARAQLDNGNFKQGRALLQSALALDLKLNRPQQLAEEYALLGRLSVLTADFDSAFSQLGNAITQYKSLIDRATARTLLLEVCSLHRQMGEEQKAYSMFAEALRLAELFKDIDGVREIQLAMLPSLRALDKTDEEAETLAELMKASMDARNLQMQARLRLESALGLFHRLRYQAAVEPLLQALTLANQARDSLSVINILATLALAYERTGNIQQAFETYTEALTRTDRTRGAQNIRLEMLIRVGTVYMRSSHYAEAIRFYRAALSSAVELKNKLAEGYLFALLANCYLGQHQPEDALASTQNVIDVFTPMSYRRGLAFATIIKGFIAQQSGRLNDALASFKEAIDHREHAPGPLSDEFLDVEQILLSGRTYYDVLIEQLLKMGRTDDAFWYAERKQERALFEQVSSLDIRTRDPNVNTLLSTFHRTRAQWIGAEQQMAKTLGNATNTRFLQSEIAAHIADAERQLTATADAILKTNAKLERAVHYGGAALADVQRQLPPGTVLLRHITTDRSVYAFAISNSHSVVQVAAIDRRELTTLVNRYSSVLGELVALADSPAVQRKPLELTLNELSNRLYSSLVRPVENMLAEANTVVITADDELVNVPFQALRKGSGRTLFLAEQFLVCYIPDLGFLALPPATAGRVRDVVALGHAGMTHWDVEYELKDIRAFYKEARLYFDQQASLSTLQREHGDVLHLALDIRFSSALPRNAMMILSDGKTRGSVKEVPLGLLLTTASFPTVIVSHLNADTVSAGKLIPALFLMNGTSSCIINEHPVSRKAKKQFGEMMYTAFPAGTSTPAAFRGAITGMVRGKDSSSPSAWAPFSLWGR